MDLTQIKRQAAISGVTAYIGEYINEFCPDESLIYEFDSLSSFIATTSAAIYMYKNKRIKDFFCVSISELEDAGAVEIIYEDEDDCAPDCKLIDITCVYDVVSVCYDSFIKLLKTDGKKCK